jgi:hypothetical protein
VIGVERAQPAEPEPSGSSEKGTPRGKGQPAQPRGTRPHRVLVRSLVVLASVVLVLSMIANWVQTQLLDSNQLSGQTSAILKNPDVQEQLSLFAVDQLYANVDVQASIEQRLPSAAQPLAAPITALTRQLATNVAQKALASPQVQSLVSNAVGRAQAQFVDLIENKDQFVSTTGGQVTLEYGSIIADLATRLGVSPATISNIQGLVREYSTNLRQGLTTAETNIQAVRASLAQVKQGQLSSQTRHDLQTLSTNAAALQTTVADLQKKIRVIKPQAPAQLQSTLSNLAGLLSDLDARLTALDQQISAVLKNPSKANVVKLDPALAALESRVTTLLNRQVIQHPGELVLMQSSQLSGLQDLVGVLRSVGFVLPILALLLYLGALYLARGWRREAMISVGGGILAAALIILVTRRLIGGAVVNSVVSSDSVKPAVTAIWDIVSGGLRQRALFVLVVGVGFIVGGVLAGPGRHAMAVRRFLAPYLRDHPIVVYSVVAVLFLLWLTIMPAINNLGQVIVIVALALLAAFGVELLRRQTAREFPARPRSS